jgi:hypothetical protein
MKVNAVDVRSDPNENGKYAYAEKMVRGSDRNALPGHSNSEPHKSEKSRGADHVEQKFFTK